ncbi:Homocysteine S-methyltransferase [Piptocephalis cylindrospora]|uniref:Homocysteine S-methyltransferase n=1 Tax=Piptocephalis cylindrospora TaxID=1907219 RepID=A0A4P9XYL2_9FUNG|nr:Homocysteine S-methyltransferase [Piptocephalis cylindrospora]|eukprot:RKP11464.1 Homocysteine S-methyltransferase [Piptocephalis cylindrospora]
MSQAFPNPLQSLPTHQGVIVVDGGLGTLLQDHLDSSSPLAKAMWNASLIVTHPSIIQDAHLQYLEAGAQIITTATYQLSETSIARAVELATAEATPLPADPPITPVGLMTVAIKAAIDAREMYYARHPEAGTRVIAISMGSTGAQLGGGREYSGDYPGWSEERVASSWKSRLAQVREAAAILGLSDFCLAIETVPSLSETRAIAQALTEPAHVHSGIWSILSLVGSKLGESSTGEPLPDLFSLLHPIPHLAAMGINCSPISIALHPLLSSPSFPYSPALFCCPNGMVWDVQGCRWLEEPEEGNPQAGSDGAYTGPERWAAHLVRQVRSGSGPSPPLLLLGGCCMTTPAHITALSRALSPISHIV